MERIRLAESTLLYKLSIFLVFLTGRFPTDDLYFCWTEQMSDVPKIKVKKAFFVLKVNFRRAKLEQPYEFLHSSYRIFWVDSLSAAFKMLLWNCSVGFVVFDDFCEGVERNTVGVVIFWEFLTKNGLCHSGNGDIGAFCQPVKLTYVVSDAA